MKKVMTPSPRRTKISDEQIGKFFDQLKSEVRKIGLSGQEFQELIKSEKDLRIKSRFRSLLEQIAEDTTGSVVVPVNYDKKDAIAAAIQAANLDWKYVGLEVSEIPLVGRGNVQRRVFEKHFGKIMYNRDLLMPDALGNLVFADPLTALLYACKLPDRQREYPLVILFNDNNGQLWYLILGGSVGGRFLYVYRDYLGGYWDDGCRCLAVRK
jgi:hypothetical protein